MSAEYQITLVQILRSLVGRAAVVGFRAETSWLGTGSNVKSPQFFSL